MSIRKSGASASASSRPWPIRGRPLSTSTRSAARSKARSAISPSSACLSACPAISTAWFTCPTSTGTGPGEDAIDNYHKGEVVRAKVLDVDVEKERISLGIKQLEADPFEAGMAKLRKGEVVTGTVAGITEGGVEVTVGDGLLGFIRKSELSRDRSEQRPDRFAVGEKVDAKITTIDRATRKVTLVDQGQEVDEEKRAMAEFGSSDSGASLGDILGAAINRARRQDADAAEPRPKRRDKLASRSPRLPKEGTGTHSMGRMQSGRGSDRWLCLDRRRALWHGSYSPQGWERDDRDDEIGARAKAVRNQSAFVSARRRGHRHRDF